MCLLSYFSHHESLNIFIAVAFRHWDPKYQDQQSQEWINQATADT